MTETSLHVALKDWYAKDGDLLEVPFGSYLIDIQRGDLLIEIQTRSFSSLKPKMETLLLDYTVRLVHPIAQDKWIVRLPAKGDKPMGRRKSPRRGRLEHLFDELVYIPHLVDHPNFSLEVLLTHEEEIRREDGRGSWRRKGLSIVDRRLLEVTESFTLSTPRDFLTLIPPNLPQPFTNRELAEALKIPPRLAMKMTYCLRAMGVLTRFGKRQRAYLHISSPQD